MSGAINTPNNREFDIREDETFSDWKRRKGEENNLPKSISQKNSSKASIGLCDRTNEKKNVCKCPKCVGRRNKNKGRRKQNLARKALKIPNSKFMSQMGHEENWATGIRVEVKSGKQIQPLVTAFYKGKQQSDLAHLAIGTGSKPFAHIAMPDGSNTGIISLELKDLENFCYEVLKNFGYEFVVKDE